MPVRWTFGDQRQFVWATAEESLAAADEKEYLDIVAAAGSMPYARFDLANADVQLTFDE